MKSARNLILGLAALIAIAGKAYAMPAPDASSVLILAESVSGGLASNEATAATAHGLTPVVVTDADWSAMTAAEFATYRALVLGDPTCGGIGTGSYIDAAIANRVVWSSVVDGNIIVNGTDPVFHQFSGGYSMTDSGVAFAGDIAGKTGLYVSLSCYYHDALPSTPVPVLDQFGAFSVTGVGCYNNAHIVAAHPALAGMTDASLSNWSCSVHEAFDGFPGDFLPLVIANGVLTGAISFPDGSSGPPYVLARGEELVPIECGNGILQAPEECDDGNIANGDGCSAQCTIEIYVPECGNGTLDAGEECDDGNTADGDGCSAECLVENENPDCSAAAASIAVLWPPNHKMHVVNVVGVTDADGDAIAVAITAVAQDEPTDTIGDGNTCPDAVVNDDGTASIRAERSGSKKVPGNGRVYHLNFVADDGNGGACSGTATVCVPHDQGQGSVCVDDGPLYSSEVCS